MNIVMVSNHACIRVQKMALPLLAKGHKVHLIARKIPSFYEAYTTVSIYDDAGQLINIIDMLEKSNSVDLYHCHNEPNWFVTLLKERTSKPVIMDVHDTYLTRSTDEEAEEALSSGKKHKRITVEERTNFQMADALVFVSEPVRDIVTDTYKLNQSNIVLPSYVPEFMYKYNLEDWQGGLVYEGKVIRESELKSSWGTGFHYCDYRDTANQCKEIGMDFHLYPGGYEQEYAKMYGDTAFIHAGVPYSSLLKDITRHDWGLVGNTLESEQWKHTLSNKMFEYMAACMPVVCINADASSKFIEENEFGITVSNIKELAERWPEHRKYRENVIKRRHEFSMESNLHILTDLYEALI
jgi:glycosyltransferase involved in cell wall biosynthesis